MNETNSEFLRNRMLNLGFGERLNEGMEKSIKEQVEKFVLPTKMEFSNNDKKTVVEYEIDFSKSKTSDMYFANKFQATIRGEESSLDRSHTFYIDKANSVTAKEAFNLLEGRAVHKKMTDKDDNPYQAWIQLDLSKKDEKGNFQTNRYHTNYGFELEKTLDKLPIKELADPVHKERLVRSLERGNVQSVTFNKAGEETKMFLEANPQMKSVNVYNDQMVKQFLGTKKETSKESSQRSEDAPKKKEQRDVTEEPPAEEKKRKRGMSV